MQAGWASLVVVGSPFKTGIICSGLAAAADPLNANIGETPYTAARDTLYCCAAAVERNRFEGVALRVRSILVTVVGCCLLARTSIEWAIVYESCGVTTTTMPLLVIAKRGR